MQSYRSEIFYLALVLIHFRKNSKLVWKSKFVKTISWVLRTLPELWYELKLLSMMVIAPSLNPWEISPHREISNVETRWKHKRKEWPWTVLFGKKRRLCSYDKRKAEGLGRITRGAFKFGRAAVDCKDIFSISSATERKIYWIPPIKVHWIEQDFMALKFTKSIFFKSIAFFFGKKLKGGIWEY